MGFKDIINKLVGSKEENECMKVLGMLDSVLDEEAQDRQQQEFHDHIEKCMPCYEKYNLDKSLKELIRHRCNNTQVPSGLVEAIKVQISQSERS